MKKIYAPVEEPNLMKYNFPSDGSVCRFVDLARDSIVHGTFRGIDHRLISNAKEEFIEFRDGLNVSTPPFADDLTDLALEGGKKRVVVVVQGQFEGDYPFPSTIGLDIGTQPYMMYKHQDRPRGQTIDDYLTREAVKSYITKHAAALRGMGVDSYRVYHSAFFYFRNTNLKSFKNHDGSVNMEALLPLVADTLLLPNGHTGYIGTNLVNLPEYRKYIRQAPSFVSHRLKSTLARKLAKQLSLPKIDESEVITDVSASRLVVLSMEAVRDLERRIRAGTVGKSTLMAIAEKTVDYYKKPKGNDYRAVKLVADVKTGPHEFVREIQLVDRAQYYRNEVNPNDPAHHRQHVKTEQLNEKKLMAIPPPILEDLQTIFGRPTMLVTLKEVLGR